MPQTRPLYNVMVTDGPGAYPYPTMNDKIGPRSLDDALAACAKYALAGADIGLVYTVEPERGTEPRYTLMVSGPNRQGSTVSWPGIVGAPWADAKAAYEQRVATYATCRGSGSNWPLTYRVVAP